IGGVFDDAAVDRDRAVGAGAGIQRVIVADDDVPLADAEPHLEAELRRRGPNATDGRIDGGVYLAVACPVTTGLAGRARQLALGRLEARLVDQRQLMRGAGAAAKQTDDRQCRQDPEPHCASPDRDLQRYRTTLPTRESHRQSRPGLRRNQSVLQQRKAPTGRLRCAATASTAWRSTRSMSNGE